MDICRPHGGIVGRCPLCRRAGGEDPATAAARVIAEIRAERHAARERLLTAGDSSRVKDGVTCG